MGSFSPQQVTLVVALVAAAAVTLAAVINFIASGRSKYVDIIAAERIKWVGELRGDFARFINLLVRVRYHHTKREASPEFLADLDVLREKQQLILLKLNIRAPLDIEIANAMQECLIAILEEEGDKPHDAINELRQRVSELLKEEWEKAKWESSGVIRKPRIWWKKLGRYDRYRRRWKKRLPTPITKARIAAMEAKLEQKKAAQKKG